MKTPAQLAAERGRKAISAPRFGQGKKSTARKTRSEKKHAVHDKENLVRAAKAKSEEKPAWDSTIHDLNKYKLSEEEVKWNRVLHMSRFDHRAQQRLEEEGISLEEQERRLQSVLSPPWLIKRKELDEEGNELNPVEVEPQVENLPAKFQQVDEVAQQQEREQIELAYKELVAQVERYEVITGRRGQQGEPQNENSDSASAEGEVVETREMDLLKLCTKLVGHLAVCERELLTRTKKLEASEARCKGLENEAEARKMETEGLNEQVQKLHAEINHLKATNSIKEEKDECSADLSSRISRRHQLMEKWKNAQIT